MQELTSNPLLEASARSLQQIFDEDPLKLTDSVIDRVVSELRAQRDLWEKAEGKKPKAQVVTGTLNLKDLGL